MYTAEEVRKKQEKLMNAYESINIKRIKEMIDNKILIGGNFVNVDIALITEHDIEFLKLNGFTVRILRFTEESFAKVSW